MHCRFLSFLAIVPLCIITGARGQDKDIRTLASAISTRLVNASKKTVAVVDFMDLEGNVTELGRYLAEEVSVALLESNNGLEVVDRTHLKTLLQEHKLNASGILDPATARKLGQIAGVEILVTGTLTPFGDYVRLAAKALDTNTARMIAASTADIARTKAIEELLNRGVAGEGISSPPGAGGGKPPESASVSVKDFVFTLRSCTARGDTLSCLFQIVNSGPDIGLFICARCNGYEQQNYPRIIDDRGNEYVATRVQVGNQVATAPGGVQAEFASNVAMTASMQFEGVPKDARTLALLEFFFDNN
jgi:TolB-like protein